MLMPIDRKIRLQTFKFKQFDNIKFLSGIQLKFTNDFETPAFQAGCEEEQGKEFKCIKVDPQKHIAAISMNVYVGAVHGVRLIDEKGDYIVDYTWHAKGALGQWLTKEIPDSQSIIGVKCLTSYNTIPKVSFLLWR